MNPDQEKHVGYIKGDLERPARIIFGHCLDFFLTLDLAQKY